MSEMRMEGFLLRFYVHENHQHEGTLLWQWLLRRADKLGLQGGSAFRSIAGFGRNHVVHEEQFFGVVSSVTIGVEFLVDANEREQLLQLLSAENIELFYSCTPTHFGKTRAG
jgi:PII-like signaling protein